MTILPWALPVSINRCASRKFVALISDRTSDTVVRIRPASIFEATHVSELNAYLELIKKNSWPSAFVYVTTPDFSSDKRPENVLEWGEFAPLEHIQFFSEKYLIILFDRYGFKFVKRYKDKKTGLKALFQRVD